MLIINGNSKDSEEIEHKFPFHLHNLSQPPKNIAVLCFRNVENNLQ